MLSTNKLRSIYSKIQTQLFYMIPEKWDKIYLYASIIEQVNHLETGEMFFYYYPAGLLKRNPINVYEIPSKFNIEEEEYTKLVDKLYDTFSELRQAFKESKEEKMWSSLTIVIANNKFTVEYSYEDLIGSKYSSEDRHIIWQCRYLGLPIERLTKKEQKMVEEYYSNIDEISKKTKSYTEGMYKKNVHNIVEYINNNEEDEKQEDDEYDNISEYRVVNHRKVAKLKKKEDKYEKYLKQKEALEDEFNKQLEIKVKKEKEKKEEEKKEEKGIRRNQILNI